MDSETRKAVQALCTKLGHEWELWIPGVGTKPEISRCKICDKSKYSSKNKNAFNLLNDR